VRELVLRIRRIASIVRDWFSADTWRILNQLQSDSRSRPGHIPMANALALLNTLVMDLGAFSGMEMENMTRGHGWRFLDFGRRLERSLSLASVLRAALASNPGGTIVIEPLLEIADSLMTYRRRYFAQARWAAALELLLADAGNPRSLAFQISALQDHVSALPRDPAAPEVAIGLTQLLTLAEILRAGELPSLGADVEAGDSEKLIRWLDRFHTGLSEISDELTQHYFSLTVARVS
jgi:uncharacterized alpha-E superfamily protein